MTRFVDRESARLVISNREKLSFKIKNLLVDFKMVLVSTIVKSKSSPEAGTEELDAIVCCGE